ncbi:mechanosensitive ion channel family protein, partial [Streptomyces sp. NPDC057757]
MNRTVTLDDWMLAATAVVAGILAAFLSRMLLRWLGKHALRTNWSGDDLVVAALRTLVPWGAIAGGIASAAAVLP